MLPPFIIEQIRRREQQERQRRDDARPRVHLPIRPVLPKDGEPVDEESDRGVVIVDVMS